MERDTCLYRGQEITEGSFFVEGMENYPLPLTSTEVRAKISGPLVDVTVAQKFVNSLEKHIEAVYVFPLPSGGAVSKLEIQVGDRVIKSRVIEKDEAKRNLLLFLDPCKDKYLFP